MIFIQGTQVLRKSLEKGSLKYCLSNIVKTSSFLFLSCLMSKISTLQHETKQYSQISNFTQPLFSQDVQMRKYVCFDISRKYEWVYCSLIWKIGLSKVEIMT